MKYGTEESKSSPEHHDRPQSGILHCSESLWHTFSQTALAFSLLCLWLHTYSLINDAKGYVWFQKGCWRVWQVSPGCPPPPVGPGSELCGGAGRTRRWELAPPKSLQGSPPQLLSAVQPDCPWEWRGLALMRLVYNINQSDGQRHVSRAFHR